MMEIQDIDVGNGCRRIERDQKDSEDGHCVKDKIKARVIPYDHIGKVFFERTFFFKCSEMPTSFYFRIIFKKKPGEGVSCETCMRRIDQGTNLVDVRLWMLVSDHGYYAGTLRHVFSRMKSCVFDSNSSRNFISENDVQELLSKRLLVEFLLTVKFCHGQQSTPEGRAVGKEAVGTRDSEDSAFHSQPNTTEEVAGGEVSEDSSFDSEDDVPDGSIEGEDSDSYSVTSPQYPPYYAPKYSPSYFPQDSPSYTALNPSNFSLKSPTYTPVSPTWEEDAEHSSVHRRHDIPEDLTGREHSKDSSSHVPEGCVGGEDSEYAVTSPQYRPKGPAGREDLDYYSATSPNYSQSGYLYSESPSYSPVSPIWKGDSVYSPFNRQYMPEGSAGGEDSEDLFSNKRL